MLKYLVRFFFQYYAVILTAVILTEDVNDPIVVVISTAVGTLTVLSIVYGLRKLFSGKNSVNPKKFV